MSVVKCGRHTIEISHGEKKLFAPTAITKYDLVTYYEAIADTMLPFLKKRPLTMLRFPLGIDHEGFYQKDMPDYFPKWVNSIDIAKKEGGVTRYIVCDSKATLVYITNQNCITPHVWLSQIDKLDYPDRMIFDIDPSLDNDFANVRGTALRLKVLLDELSLPSFVMTTGSRGLHVVVPLKKKSSFDHVRLFAKQCASLVVKDDPKHVTLEINKKKRRGKIFLDYLRNSFAATAVAPYGVRPKPGAPVATPLDWQAVNDKKLTSQRYTIKNVFSYLDKNPEVWHNFRQSAVLLGKAERLLRKKYAVDERDYE